MADAPTLRSSTGSPGRAGLAQRGKERMSAMLKMETSCSFYHVVLFVAAGVVVCSMLFGLIAGAVEKGQKAGFQMGAYARDAALPGLGTGLLLAGIGLVINGRVKAAPVLTVGSFGVGIACWIAAGLSFHAEGKTFIQVP